MTRKKMILNYNYVERIYTDGKTRGCEGCSDTRWFEISYRNIILEFQNFPGHKLVIQFQ